MSAALDVRPAVSTAPATRTLAVLVVAAVVAFDPWGYAPFGPLKWALITTLVLLAAAFALRRRLEVHRISAFGWLGFLVWAAVTSLFAVDPLHAWIGTPDRHLGMVAWVLFAVVFLVAQGSNAETDRRLMVRTAVGAIMAVGAYTLAELAGLDPVTITGEGTRAGGSFGSPAYLGAALTLLLPVSAAAAADSGETPSWRWAAGIGVAVGLVAVTATQTRAAWLGVAVALAVTIPVWWPWLRRRLWVVAAVAAVLVVVVVASPVGDRVGSAVDFEDGGARARVDEWRIGVDAFVAYPVIGAGFEGYRTVFPDHVDADYARRYGREVAADRAHNGALDVGIATGLPGAALYLVGAGWLALRALRAIRSRDLLLVGIAAGVVGYIAQQQFLFPAAEIDPVFWVFAGLLVAATRSDEAMLVVPPRRSLRIACLALAAVAATAGVLDIVADHQAQTARERSAAGEPAAALDAADAARRLRPDSIRYGVVAAAVAADAGDLSGYDTAIARIEGALDRSPTDPILLARRARYLLDRARFSGDPGDLAAATEAWRRLAEDDPNNPSHRLELGVSLVLGGDPAGAEAAWLAAEDLAPARPAPAANLALLYLEAGRIEAAADAAQRALALDPDDPALVELVERIEGEGTP